MSESLPTIALLGNPNAGKSSLFNHLTGLNQKVGNFAGVTVEKKSGSIKIDKNEAFKIIDLPGTYSLYPKSADQRVVFDIITNQKNIDHPDRLIVVADASNLRRNLLLFSQLADLEIPALLVLTMNDVAGSHQIFINEEILSSHLGVNVLKINARTGDGINLLIKAIQSNDFHIPKKSSHKLELETNVLDEIQQKLKLKNHFFAFLSLHHFSESELYTSEEKQFLAEVKKKQSFDSIKAQAKDTISRYAAINEVVSKVITQGSAKQKNLSAKLDKIFTHSIFGYCSFLMILFVVFQAIFSWATYPMDLIESGIGFFNAYLKSVFGNGPFMSLITDGLIAGMGGVLIFIPQIALLFLFISILEETGYMARVMFIMDKLMRQFGMSGNSVIPLVSGVACAVPAIMSARTIDNKKDRLITIFVTPLISCSARIPVFTVLIALIVPNTYLFGVVNIQGLMLLACYFLGFLAAIFTALLLKLFLKNTEKSYFIMELPTYKLPRWKNVFITIFNKIKSFVFDAGKVIIAISMVLWVLASFGPGSAFKNAELDAIKITEEQNLTYAQMQDLIGAKKLEASYAGIFGKFIEPAIRPLGFDWKIGIALITSFAAREVFVGTMSTIYSIGSDDAGNVSIIQKMKSEKRINTNKPMFDIPLCLSLIVFYMFAMQCMSTLAVTYKETGKWYWPMLQLAYMTVLAYGSSMLVYQILS